MTQAFNLSQLANKVNSSGQLDGATGLTGTITSTGLSITGNSYLATSSGSVGIGTTSPNAKLQTNSGNGAGTITKHIQLQSDAGEDNVTLRIAGTPYTGATQASIDFNINAGTNFQTYMAFGTSAGSGAVERMRIDSSGNVLINQTSQGGSAGVFAVANTAGSGGVVMITSTNNNTYFAAIFKNASNTNVGNINCTVSATAYVTSSDYRLKENIVPMTGALDKVAQLKPVTYTWKEDGSDGQGFIAHELQEIVPDCVTGEKDAVDEEGNIKPQGIDTSFLVATLTAAIQEQQTIINDLKARIETLELK